MSEDTFKPFAIVKDVFNTVRGTGLTQEAEDLYPSGTGIGDEADAWRHLVWTAEMTRKYGKNIARGVSDWHELPITAFLQGASLLQTPEEKQMDLFNNALGIEIGQSSQSLDEIKQKATEAIRSNRAKLLDKPVDGQY
jgi:hypothetical protein